MLSRFFTAVCHGLAIEVLIINLFVLAIAEMFLTLADVLTRCADYLLNYPKKDYS